MFAFTPQWPANAISLKENPAIAKEIEDKIRDEKLGKKKDSKAPETDDAELAPDSVQ